MKGIALACTGISSIGIDKNLNEITDIPVIDPVYAEAIAINSVCEFNDRI
jgi:Asp/Glu/hydantoin racemase